MNKCVFIMIWFLLGLNAFSQEVKDEKKKDEVAKAPNVNESKATPPPGPPGPPWWISSAVGETIDSKLKFHFELDTKYTYQSGTLDSHLIEASSLLAIRKNRFTNFMFLDSGFIDANQKYVFYQPNQDNGFDKIEGSQKILLRKVQFVEIFRTDFTKNWFFDLGYEAYRDDLTYIRLRNTYFGGIGHQFDLNKKHHFSFMLGLGYEDTKYTTREQLNARIPAAISIDETPDSGAMYFQYKGKIMLSQKIEFHQSFFYTMYFDNDRNDRWEAKVRLMFPLRRNLFFFTAFEGNYENNNIGEAAGAENFNTKIINGLKFSF